MQKITIPKICTVGQEDTEKVEATYMDKKNKEGIKETELHKTSEGRTLKNSKIL